MATDLTGLVVRIGLNVSAALQKALDLNTMKGPVTFAKELALTFGTGALKADQVFADRRILAASGQEDLDLAGTLLNAVGGTVNFANIKAIVIINRSDETTTSPEHTATDASIKVGGASATEFLGPFEAAGDQINIPAGGSFMITCPDDTGWVVTADTADLFAVENNDGVDEAMYDVILIGESA